MSLIVIALLCGLTMLLSRPAVALVSKKVHIQPAVSRLMLFCCLSLPIVFLLTACGGSGK